MEIHTARLRLVPGTRRMLLAELESPQALATVLGIDVAPSWPPELYDYDAVRHMLAWLGDRPGHGAWGFYYVVERSASGTDSGPPWVVGAGGYKGAPDASGAVEIGCSITPERRRCGYAREAVDGWLAHAFADPRVTRVIAHTLVGLEPSIAVLRSAGFSFAGAGSDPQEPSAVQYVIPREAYERSRASRHVARIVAD